jgi:DNA repair exonuclease SbcCD ATPase subunit
MKITEPEERVKLLEEEERKIKGDLPKVQQALTKKQEEQKKIDDQLEESILRNKPTDQIEKALLSKQQEINRIEKEIKAMEERLKRIPEEREKAKYELAKERQRLDELKCEADLQRLQEIQEETCSIGQRLVVLKDRMDKSKPCRKVRRRIDFVRIRWTDPKIIEMKSPRHEQVSYVANPISGQPLDHRIEKVTLEKPTDSALTETMEHWRAIQLEKQGKAEIIEEVGPPQWEEEIRWEESKLNTDFTNLNLGVPVTVDGKMSPYFKEMGKRIGWGFSLTLSDIARAMTKEEKGRILKEIEQERK